MDDLAPVETPTEFLVYGEDIELADMAFRALRSDATVDTFQRGRLLVRVVANNVSMKRVTLPAGIPIIEPMTPPMLRARLARLGRWELARKGNPPCLPPMWLVQTLMARADWDGLPQLEGVVESPVMRHDGSVVSQPGYDLLSHLVYHQNGHAPDYPSIPSVPTLEDAKAAALTLMEPMTDFPFREASDQAAALAAILSLVGRHAIAGCVPMFVIRSPAPGNGKSLLADVISIIGTGRPAPRVSPDDDNAEFRKLILSISLSGMSTVLLDNLTGKVGSKGLSAALTAETWQDRYLGESRMVEAPLRCVWIATGNNLSFKGDLGRRVVVCDLDAGVEHPEDRPESAFQHPSLLEYVLQNRPGFVASALTILRGFHMAGRPKHDAPRKGSFEAWDSLVRAACVWIGVGDPDGGKERVREDGDMEIASLRAALDDLSRVFFGDAFTTSDVMVKAEHDEDLRASIGELTSRDKLERGRMGYAFRQVRDRMVNGMALKRVKTTKSHAVWRVDGATPKLL